MIYLTKNVVKQDKKELGYLMTREINDAAHSVITRW